MLANVRLRRISLRTGRCLWMGHDWLGVAILAFGAALTTAAAEARPGIVSTSGEVRLSLVHPMRGSADRDGDAQRMLEIIRHSLAQGDLPTAEAQLDILEGRFPGSPAAVEARSLVARHTTAAPETRPPVAAQPPQPRAPEPLPGSQRAAPDVAERPAAGEPAKPWTTEVRRVRALAQEFQTATGDRIFFSPASAELGSRAKAVISAQADWLKRNPRVPVLLSAHADDIGSREFNAELSLRRGEAVKQRLVAEGIEPERIKVVAHGREHRIAICESAACAAQNRRVITVIGDSEPPLPGVAARPR